MIYVLFILAVFSATFLNSNISTVLGYENNVTTVAFLPLTLFIIIQLMRKKIVILKKTIIVVDMSYWLAFLYCFLNCHMDSMICLKQFYYFRLSHILLLCI